jgi:ABC-type Fe3+-citrate transport system substrate-binding protein
VDERAKLQSSWKRINTSAESILKTVSKMVEKEIPMQDMMSSEKNGLTTWWTSIPFTGNDFLPCISVSDELFIASTSKTYSESLSEQFKKGGGDARKGAWMHVDFKVLNQYAGQWLELVTKNAEDVFPSESAREDFATNKPMIDKALQAFGSIEEMTLHARNEGGRSRISFHLKAK